MGCDTKVTVEPSVTDVVVRDERPRTSVQPKVTRVVRAVGAQRVVRSPSTGRVVETVTKSKVVTVTTPGPEGPIGPPGPAGGTTVPYLAGETIFGLRAVRAEGNRIYHPDQLVIEHAKQTFGIALQSGSADSELLVQLSGQLEEQSWAWAPGFVYCGTEGQLTQSPPTTGWLLAVGRATGPTTLNIDIDTPFVRA